jgi:hypothetical protein
MWYAEGGGYEVLRGQKRCAGEEMCKRDVRERRVWRWTCCTARRCFVTQNTSVVVKIDLVVLCNVLWIGKGIYCIYAYVLLCDGLITVFRFDVYFFHSCAGHIPTRFRCREGKIDKHAWYVFSMLFLCSARNIFLAFLLFVPLTITFCVPCASFNGSMYCFVRDALFL